MMVPSRGGDCSVQRLSVRSLFGNRVPDARFSQVRGIGIGCSYSPMRRWEAILARVKTLPALMLAAAGVGFGHAVMPDHWMPLAVLSRTQRYSTRRTVRLSLAAGVTHVLVSLVLGAVLVVVGLQFRGTVARHTDVVIGGVLLVTGLVFVAMEMVGRGHRHDHDDNHHH